MQTVRAFESTSDSWLAQEIQDYANRSNKKIVGISYQIIEHSVVRSTYYALAIFEDKE